MRARYSASLEGRVIAVSFDAVPGSLSTGGDRVEHLPPETFNNKQRMSAPGGAVKGFVQTHRRPRPNRDLETALTFGFTPL